MDQRVAVFLHPQSIRRGTAKSLRKIAQCMLVHARLPDMYLYHALLHACNVFNMLPLKDLVTADGTATAPFKLFLGS